MATVVAILKRVPHLMQRGTDLISRIGFSPVFPTSVSRVATSSNVQDEDDLTLSRIWTRRTASPAEARSVLEQIESPALILFVEEAYLAPRRAPLNRSPLWRESEDRPNLSLYWWHDAINLKRARKLPGYTHANDIVISVVDTGVDETHPALMDVTIRKENFTQQLDTDEEGHGTHVCGILAGRPTAHRSEIFEGVSGANLYVAKAIAGSYDTDELYYQAIRSASLQGQVLNMSEGGQVLDRTEALIIGMAIKRNVPVISAMGNAFESGNPVYYPAAIDGVIAVGASDQMGRRAGFSCTGAHICIAAPGVDIWSAYPGAWAVMMGTSMAAPMVSAAIALMLSKNRGLTLGDIRNILKDSANSETGYSQELGWGVLDVKKALEIC